MPRFFIEQQGWHGKRDSAIRPPLGRHLKSSAETACQPSHQDKADREQDDRCRPRARTEYELSGEAQGESGGDPDDETDKEETTMHNMNLNPYSYHRGKEDGKDFRNDAGEEILPSCG